MLRMVVGHSDLVDAQKAVDQCIGQCREALDGRKPQAGILYTSLMDCDHAGLLAACNQAFPGLELVGCTTDGEMSGLFHFTVDSVALALFASDRLAFGTGMCAGLSRDPYGAVKKAVDQARAGLGGDPEVCIVLCDGLTTLAAPLGSALDKAVGPGVPVVGGTAGDQFAFKRTLQFKGGEVASDAVSVLLVGGGCKVSSACASGWVPLGPEFTIDEFEGNVVRRIGGHSAADFYRHYLAGHEREYSQFPLAVYEEGNPDAFHLRDPVLIDEDDGSMVFVGTFPDKCVVRLSEAGREDILAAAGAAVDKAADLYPGDRVEAALIFTCASRRRILGSKAGEESAAVAARLPGAPLFGFATYGEIAPLTPGGPTLFHNDTIAVLLLGE